MASFAEVYLSTLSGLMAEFGIERHFTAFLEIVNNSGKLTQKDLAERLRKDKVYVMRVVDYLSEKDLIERKIDQQDRRCQLLVSTKKANELAPIVADAIKKTNEILLQSFTAEEVACFDAGFDKLQETIKTLPDAEYTINPYKRKKD